MASIKTSCDLNKCMEIEQTCAVFNLRKASRVVTQLYEEITRPSGVLPTQFTLLVVARALGPIAISRMAEILHMDRTTLTRNLKPLERDGLLAVNPVAGDRRSREVSLTRKGLERLERALPLWQEAQERVTQALGAERLKRMLNDLRVLVEVLGND